MKYLKHINESIESENYIDSLINWNLIADLKDMSLEYIDDGYALFLDVLIDINSNKYIIYALTYTHDINKENRNDYLSSKIKPIISKDISYSIILADTKSGVNYSENINLPTKWVRERIKKAYPKEDIFARCWWLF